MTISNKKVYFLKPIGMDGPIKIGCSSFVVDRLHQIATWSPFPLELIYSEPGKTSLERQLHRHFADYHSHQEWFHPGPRLLAAVEKLRSGSSIADAIDLSAIPAETLPITRNAKSPDAAVVGSFKTRVERARQHCSAVNGVVIGLPEEVREILNSAGGYRQDYRPLNHHEVEILESFISKCREPKNAAHKREVAA